MVRNSKFWGLGPWTNFVRRLWQAGNSNICSLVLMLNEKREVPWEWNSDSTCLRLRNENPANDHDEFSTPIGATHVDAARYRLKNFVFSSFWSFHVKSQGIFSKVFPFVFQTSTAQGVVERFGSTSIYEHPTEVVKIFRIQSKGICLLILYFLLKFKVWEVYTFLKL